MSSTENNAMIEAVIFGNGGEITMKMLTQIIGKEADFITQGIEEYNAQERGTTIVTDGKVVAMRVAGAYGSLVESMYKEAHTQELGKASLEVLAIVLYKGVVTGTDIEYIRGVNSNYIVRQLTMRGLLSKTKEGLSYKYMPTVDLMAELGLTDLKDLPERDTLLTRLKTFEDERKEQE